MASADADPRIPLNGSRGPRLPIAAGFERARSQL
jgi:hypothetical protein